MRDEYDVRIGDKIKVIRIDDIGAFEDYKHLVGKYGIIDTIDTVYPRGNGVYARMIDTDNEDDNVIFWKNGEYEVVDSIDDALKFNSDSKNNDNIIGKRVIVVDAMLRYRSYDDWVYKNAPNLLCKFKKSKEVEIDMYSQGTIIAKANHSETSSIPLYLVNMDNGSIILIDEDGLRLDNNTITDIEMNQMYKMDFSNPKPIKVTSKRDKNTNALFVMISNLATICVSVYDEIGIAIKSKDDIYVEEMGKALSFYRKNIPFNIDHVAYTMEVNNQLGVTFITFKNFDMTLCIKNNHAIGYTDSKDNGKEVAYFNMMQGGVNLENY